MISSARLASPSQLKVSPTMKSTPASSSPADLLLERLAHAAHGFRIVRLVGVGVGEIAREQGAALVRHLLRDLQRLAVERLEDVLLADDLELLAMAVIGERLDHVGAGAHELAVELAHRLGGVEHDLRHVRPRLEVAAPLQLEQIALGADHRPLGQPLQQSFPGHRALPCLPSRERWPSGGGGVNHRRHAPCGMGAPARFIGCAGAGSGRVHAPLAASPRFALSRHGSGRGTLARLRTGRGGAACRRALLTFGSGSPPVFSWAR